MKKFKEIFEQHRKEGRFRPVKPHNVQNISLGSPRPSSDSASVKLKEDLRKWFSKTDPAGDWKRINSKGEAIGPCAREPGEPKPKCMSRAKRESLTKKERASAVRAKRKHDPNPERKGEPINVSNFGKGKISENMENLDEKNVPTSPEKWAQAKAQAKAKFDVYPSAYANGWAAKKYKAMGGGWKSVSEENSLLEKWSQKYKSSIDCDNPKGFSQKAHCDGKEKNINEEKKDQYDEGEYDQEGDMAKSDLRSIMANAKRVHDMLEDNDNLPEWVQSKITKAEDYMSTVANYLSAEMNEVSQDLAAKYLEKVTHDQLKRDGMKPNMYGRLEPKRQKGVDRALDRLTVKEGTKPPFDQPYTTVKKVVTDKSGAKHSPMSRARDIARKAMQKQIEGMKKMPVKEETRKASIVKKVMKKKTRSEDAFQKDPELSTTISKI